MWKIANINMIHMPSLWKVCTSWLCPTSGMTQPNILPAQLSMPSPSL